MKYKCLKCGAIQEFEENITPISCHKCGKHNLEMILDAEQYAIPDGRQKHLAWAKSIYNDDSLWHKDAFTKFPSVIAHEYNRLHELCGEGQVYALYFQMRDLIETTLKFEILAICAWGYHAQIPDFESNIACRLVSKSLTLGLWESIGNSICTMFQSEKVREQYQMPEVMWQTIKRIRDVYNKNTLVNWRNERIGHGALGFAEDEEFQKDIMQKIEVMRGLYNDIDASMRAHHLYSGDYALMGCERARNLQNLLPKDASVCLRIEGSDLDFCISPYMMLENGSIFFFDNQKKMISQMLCYPSGKRMQYEESHFTSLLKKVTPSEICIEDSVEDKFYLAAEEDYLNGLGIDKSFVKPKYLVDWLNEQLKTENRGVFLLCMSRGTGKSTFAEMMHHSHGLDKIGLEGGIEIHTYHIVHTQLRSADDFCSGIVGAWMDGELKGLSGISREPKNPSDEVAKFLGECRKAVESGTSGRYQKIAMVIDGLDEITDSAIWRYIPRADQLAEGVYVILTSRFPTKGAEDDLPDGLAERLEAIQPTSRYDVDRSCEENQEFLRGYLNKIKLDSLTDDEKEELLRAADYRVLNLSMLCKLLKSGMPLNSLPDSQNLVSGYMQILEDQYGQKEAAQLRKLLGILSTLGECEPLSLRELARLLGDGHISLRLMGMMSDVSSMLKIERGFVADGRRYPGENRYRMANAGLAKSVRLKIPEPELSEITRELCVNARNEVRALLSEKTLPEVINRVDSDISLIYAHQFSFQDLGENFRIVNEESPDTGDHAGIHISAFWAMENDEETDMDHMTYVFANHYSNILGFINSDHMLLRSRQITGYKECAAVLAMRTDLKNRMLLAETFTEIGICYDRLKRVDRALDYYDQACKVYEKLEPVPVQYLANAYRNLALTLRDAKRYSESIGAFKRSCENLEKEEHMPETSIKQLAWNWESTGSLLQSLNQKEEALEAYLNAAKYYEMLEETSPQKMVSIYRSIRKLAYAGNISFRNLKVSYTYTRKLHASRKEIKSGIRTDSSGSSGKSPAIAAMNHAWKLSWKQLNVQTFCFSIGIRKIREQAKAEYLEALRLCKEETENLDSCIWLNKEFARLALQFADSSCYRNETEKREIVDEGIRQCLRAIELEEYKRDKGLFVDVTRIAEKYGLLAKLQSTIGEAEASLKSIDRVCRIYEELEKAGENSQRDQRAVYYARKARIFEAIGKDEEALEMIRESRRLRDDWLKEQRFLGDYELQYLESNEAFLLNKQGRYNESIEFCQKQIPQLRQNRALYCCERVMEEMQKAYMSQGKRFKAMKCRVDQALLDSRKKLITTILLLIMVLCLLTITIIAYKRGEIVLPW